MIGLKKTVALFLAAAAAVCAVGCTDTNVSSSGGASGSDSSATNSSRDETSADGGEKFPQSEFEFSQVAMGGGGFVSGVFATSKEGLYYARTDVGGAYRYDSEKEKWISVSYSISEDDRGLLGVESLAFDAKNPAKLYLLCGTEYFSNGKTCLLISEDYGETFTRTELTEQIKIHGNGMGRGNGEKMAVDPKNSDIIYIGGRTGGLIKSTDGGKTFTELDMGTKTATANGNGICSVIIDEQSGDDKACSTIYVALSRTGEDNLYKSTDGGETWAAVKDAPKGIMVQRMKWNGAGKLLITYADVEGPWNNNRTNGGIRMYDPQTDTFTDITPSPKGYGDIVCDPENPDRMIACTENIYVAQPNGGYGDEFYMTSDGGKNWKLMNSYMTMSANGLDWIKTSSMHWCSSMAIDPVNKRVMVVSGNGIFACDDPFGEKPDFYFFAKGVEETVPFEIVSIPGGPLVTAIGDYDGFCQPDAETYGDVHNSIAGTMTSISVAAKATDVWVKSGGNDKTPGFWYTLDGGKTWENPRATVEGKVGYAGYASVSCDGKVFYWAPENGIGVYYSEDLGKTWTKSEGAVSVKYISCDPVNPDYVYATSNGSIYISSDGGKTFKPNMELAVFSATRPIVTPDTEGKIYYSAMGLQISEDHGTTFTRVDSVASCLAVGIGKGKTDSDPYTIFIWGKPVGAEEIGIYWSEDNGESWKRCNTSETQFGGPGNGYLIKGDFNTYGRVYMSTVGMGVAFGDLVGDAD